MLNKLQMRLRYMLLGWSPHIRAYRRYRKDGMALNHKITDVRRESM